MYGNYSDTSTHCIHCVHRIKMPGRGFQQTKAFPGISVAQVVEIDVGDCAIESVVVFQDRAEVKRAVPVHLTPGENEVIVYGLSEHVIKNSIRYSRLKLV